MLRDDIVVNLSVSTALGSRSPQPKKEKDMFTSHSSSRGWNGGPSHLEGGPTPKTDRCFGTLPSSSVASVQREAEGSVELLSREKFQHFITRGQIWSSCHGAHYEYAVALIDAGRERMALNGGCVVVHRQNCLAFQCPSFLLVCRPTCRYTCVHLVKVDLTHSESNVSQHASLMTSVPQCEPSLSATEQILVIS